MSLLSEIEQRLVGMSEQDKTELEQIVQDATLNQKWFPNEGPQTDAYFSDAFLTLYGGAGGGGKSDCGLGLAFTAHQRSLIMRRKYTNLSGLIDRAVEIHGNDKGLNRSPPPKFTTDDGRIIDFGAAQYVGDEQSKQGIPHDLLYFDEAAQFAESQIRFLMGWVRSSDPNQRCRVMLGSNPPLSDEGMWMIKMFAPWLDEQHPNPAKPGELRWFLTDAGEDFEVPESGNYEFNGVQYVKTHRDPSAEGVLTALSRTFIPAKLADNPTYNHDSQYKAQMDALPKHLRDAIRDGKFTGAREDHDLQLIPSQWIQAAMDRWKPNPPDDAPMCSIGVDVARGGKDNFVVAPRYDAWFQKLIKKSGREIDNGSKGAGLILQHRTDGAVVVVDMGGGYGGAVYDKLVENVDDDFVIQHKGSESTHEKTKSGRQTFYNKRAWLYYRFYEALNPDQPGGSRIALPPDPRLFGQLCSIRLKYDDVDIIQLEPKVDLVKRVGESPDEADAVVQSWGYGPKQNNFRGGWTGYVSGGRSQRKVIKPDRSARRFDSTRATRNN